MITKTFFLFRFRKEHLYPLLLPVVWILPFWLLTNRMSEPLGGFQSPLEATSLLAAEHFTDASFLFPSLDGKETFLETPGLYPYLIHLFSEFHPQTLIVARSISILSFFGISLMLYLIGSRIRSKACGFLAAILYTGLPISVLLGRNIQGHSLALFFFLMALWLFLRDHEAVLERRVQGVSLYGPGFLYALAALTDYLSWFGATGWLIWVWRDSSTKRLFADKRFRVTLFLGAGLPLLIALIRAFGQPATSLDGFLGTFRVNTAFLFFRSLFLQKELIWALSPLVLTAVLGACFFYIRRKDLHHPLVTWMALVQLLPFLFFAKYSFYLLPAVPFLILMLSLGLDGLQNHTPWKQLRWLIPAILFASGLSLALVLTVHSKYGYTELHQAKMLLQGFQGSSSNGTVLVNTPFYETNNKELRYYFLNNFLIPIEQATTDSNQQLVLSSLSVRMFLRPFTKEGAMTKTIKRTEYIADFFGYGLQIEKNPHFFQFDSWKTVGDLPRFPVYIHPLEEIPILELSLHPQNTRVFRQGDKFIFREN